MIENHTEIKVLNFSYGKLTKLFKNGKFENIIIIDLKYNNITELTKNTFNKNFMKLQYLHLRKNFLMKIDDEFFKNLNYLNYLDLSYSKIDIFNENTFYGLINLKKLKIEFSRILNIDKRLFKSFKNLEYFYLNESLIENDIFSKMIKDLPNLKYFYTKYFSLCCISKKISQKLIECKPKNSLIKSCEDMIGSKILRIAIWLVAASCIIGNIFTFTLKLTFSNKRLFSWYMGLNISDFLTGVYLVIIANY